MMYSLRKWIFRPKRSDQSVLAGFFYADEELNLVAAELDSFDGRKDPERCTSLVNQLRVCQDKVLGYIEKIMDDSILLERASRDFRVKFPDDVLQESLSGQLWFGAECLAAGSSIMNREVESASMRPLAKTLTRHLDYLRSLLRDQCLRNINSYTDTIKDALIAFDRLFAEFELSYVSAMVPVKTMKEYDVLQEVIVLFSETTQRALRLKLLTQDMVDDCDPALMFTIPRLAMVVGLLVYPEGPLNPDMDPVNMSEMFRPFQTLLYKIRELLWTLSKEELWMLEKSLCTTEEQSLLNNQSTLCSYPDDVDPYENLILDPTDSHYNGAVAPPELDIDNVLELPLDNNRMLGVVREDYRMSQSPSTMTLVAQVEPPSSSESDATEDASDLNCLIKTKKARKHLESTDSGHGSALDASGNITLPFEGATGESRSLRHSLSWPEPTRRSRRNRQRFNRRSIDVDFLDDNSDSDENARKPFTHQSSHDFNLHLPLNTNESLNGPISQAWDQTPTNAVDLGSTRVFFTNDCVDSTTSPVFDSQSYHQIAYVTDALNEVFVTDQTFQTSLISAVTSKALNESLEICTKCGDNGNLSSECNMSDTHSSGSKNDYFMDHLNDFNISQGNLESSSGSSNETTPPKLQNKNKTEAKLEGKSEAQSSTNTKRPDLPRNALSSGPQSEGSMIQKDVDESTEESPLSKNKTLENVPEKSEFKRHHANTSTCDQSDPSVPSSSNSCIQDTLSHPESSSPYKRLKSPSRGGVGDMDVSKIQRLRYTKVVCSACHVKPRSRSPSVDSTDVEWDRESYNSSETSSYNSECHDDEEIALAIQAAELASRREARSRFKSSTDLIHRLFVCISGVADQLQTNYASDLRRILKDVFECNSSEPFLTMDEGVSSDSGSARSDPLPDEITDNTRDDTDSLSANGDDAVAEDPPKWVPDEESPHCESCEALFTFVRRRHHCRNCGKIFCGRCSSNAVPLPHFGHTKPVRVCNRCFLFQVNPFTVE